MLLYWKLGTGHWANELRVPVEVDWLNTLAIEKKQASTKLRDVAVAVGGGIRGLNVAVVVKRF